MTLAQQSAAAGLEAIFLDYVEDQARRHFNLTPTLTNDRERLCQVLGGRPGFPGWFPREAGGADGFWIDWQDRSGRTRVTGGALLYPTGPATFAELVNAGGLDADGHIIRLEREAETVAGDLRGPIVFSGNLVVIDKADRATDLSRWFTEMTPLMNKALANAVYGEPAAYVTILRDVQVGHLQPRYRLPVLVPGVRWEQRFQPETTGHLGVQTPTELRDALSAVLH